MNKQKKLRKIIIIKSHVLSFDLVKDKIHISNIKNIINNAIEQTQELRKIFYLMLMHELERRLAIDNENIIVLRNDLREYCKSQEEEEMFELFKKIIEETTGKTNATHDWGISHIKKEGFKDLGAVDTTKITGYDWYSWSYFRMNGSKHFDAIGLDVSDLDTKDKKFLQEVKFIQLIKNHGISY